MNKIKIKIKLTAILIKIIIKKSKKPSLVEIKSDGGTDGVAGVVTTKLRVE